ncbi:MAG: hypothetical protein U0236_04845 [Nitrospira sp.]
MTCLDFLPEFFFLSRDGVGADILHVGLGAGPTRLAQAQDCLSLELE